ncbi:uncharacterized protein PG986_006048 [Apiospora aurea]|uniref:Uncharacterized protein n=1 Tax=Apiospora aurea TaxID=335848 RepID=A0ABR1QJA4_9PEZI
MFSPHPIVNPSPGAGSGSGSAPSAVSQDDEHELPSLGSPLPGRYGVILKGGMTTVVVDLVQSPPKYREIGKEQGQQSDAPSSLEPGAPRRSYLAAFPAFASFADRSWLLPPKGPDDEIWFMEPGELRKRNLSKLQATPGLYKVLLDGPPRDVEMEAGIIADFIKHKEAQRVRLRDGFFSDKRWHDMVKEYYQWQSRLAFLDLDQRKAAIAHILPGIRIRMKAAFTSYQNADVAIGAELAGIQLSTFSPSPPKPLVSDSQEKKTQWAWDMTSYSCSISNRVLTPVERRRLEVGPEFLPPEPAVSFTPPGLSHAGDQSSSAINLPRMFDLTLDHTDDWSPHDRRKFYKTYGYHAAQLYLKYFKSSPDQRCAEVDVPEWFHVFETQSKVFISHGGTAHRRFIDLNFLLGSLAIKVRDEKARVHAQELQDDDQSSGSRNEYHKPHPHWSMAARRRNGGWWRCRSDGDAPLSERRCRLCHGIKPSSTSFTLNEGHATQAKFDLLMETIQAAQRVVAKRDRHVVENWMRAEAQAARQTQTSSASSSHAHGSAVERVRAEFYAECAARDRLHRRPLGSTADEERTEAAKRLDARRSRLSAHF